jgi:hypothetical protein
MNTSNVRNTSFTKKKSVPSFFSTWSLALSTLALNQRRGAIANLEKVPIGFLSF